MSQRAAGSRSSTSERFVCPICNGRLDIHDSFHWCNACDRSYPISDGLSTFLSSESTHGEFSRSEMRELIAAAKENGWKVALEGYVKSRRPRVVDLIISKDRTLSIQVLEEIGGGRVLDFGCGFGGVSLELANIFQEVVSVDGSLERVSFLNVIKHQEGIGNVFPVCHSDVLQLPFPDAHFDAIVLIGVFEYLPQSLPRDSVYSAHEKCLLEFQRVLKTGGHLYIATKNRFGWQYIQGQADHSGIRFAPILPRGLVNLISLVLKGKPYRIINYSMPGYNRLLSRAGFDAVRFWWPIPDYQLPKRILGIDEHLGKEFIDLTEESFSKAKKSIIKMMIQLGICKYVIPNYCILARKRH